MSKDQATHKVRAATFPFFPHGGPQDWPALDAVLERCWQLSTKLANWAMSELFLADQLTLGPAAAKLGPMPSVYLYGLFRRSYPDYGLWQGAMQQAATILRCCEKKYKDMRFDIIARGSCSLPSFRFPYPFPVHNQSWRPFYGADNVPLVEVALPGAKVVLRLRGGNDMRRQLTLFRQLVEGAKRGELALHRRGKHVLVKLVGWFPLVERAAGDGVLLVRTDPQSFWVAEGENIQPRLWNQDHMPRKIENHRVWLQRISEDLKYEKRVPRPMRRHMLQKIDERCRKHNARLDTFCHEMTSQLVQFAVRQKVATLLYDDTVQEYMPRFPWFRLREKLRYKLEEVGMQFLVQGGPAQAM